MSSGDKPILTLKISLINFADFDILKILILKLYFLAIIVSSQLPPVELSVVYVKPILKL